MDSSNQENLPVPANELGAEEVSPDVLTIVDEMNAEEAFLEDEEMDAEEVVPDGYMMVTDTMPSFMSTVDRMQPEMDFQARRMMALTLIQSTLTTLDQFFEMDLPGVSWQVLIVYRMARREQKELLQQMRDQGPYSDEGTQETWDSPRAMASMAAYDVEPQSGYADGALENTKRYNRNQYARKQYRKKKKAREERMRILDLAEEWKVSNDRKAAKRRELFDLAEAKQKQAKERHANQMEELCAEMKAAISFSVETRQDRKAAKKKKVFAVLRRQKPKITPEMAAHYAKQALKDMEFAQKNYIPMGHGSVEVPTVKTPDVEFQAGVFKHFDPENWDHHFKQGETFLKVVLESISAARESLFPEVKMWEKKEDELGKRVMAAVERIALLVKSLSICTTTEQVVLTIVSFLSHSLENGIGVKLAEILAKSLCSEHIEHQVGLVEAYSSFKDTWSKVKNSSFVGRLMSLLSLIVPCVLSGLFGLQATNFDFNKYVGLSKGKMPEKVSVMELVLDNIIFFIDKGFAFFTGGVTNLLYDDARMTLYDAEYVKLVAYFPNVEMNTLEETIGMSLSKFLTSLHANKKECDAIIAAIPKHSDRRFLVDRQIKIQKMIDETTKKVIGHGTRIKPFCVMLEGPSSTGKTNLKTMISRQVQLSNPDYFRDDPAATVTVNGDDQFDTEVDNSHDTIIYDDAGNTVPLYSKGNICQKIINIANNEPKAVLKADVDSKGKVWYSPNMLVVTTNIEHLHATSYSVDPGSVLRRFDIVARVRVKPDFVEENGVGLDRTKVKSLFTDIWLFDLYKHIPTADRRSKEVRLTHKGKLMTGVGFQDFMELITEMSKDHFYQQDRLLVDQRSVKSMPLCEHGYLNKMCTLCTPLEDQAGVLSIATALHVGYSQRAIWKHQVQWHLFTYITAVITAAYMFGYGVLVPFILLLLWSYSLTHKVRTALFVAKNSGLFKVVDYAAAHRYDFLAGVVSVAAVATVLSGLRAMKHLLSAGDRLEHQGASYSIPGGQETPITSCYTVQKTPVASVDHKLKTMTLDQGVKLVKDKLCYAEFQFEKTREFSDILPLKSNVWLVNWHTLSRHPTEVAVFVGDGSPVGPSFKCKVHPLLYRQIEGSDLGVIYLPRGGSQKDIMHMFAGDIVPSGGKGRLIYQPKEGEATDEVVRYDYVPSPLISLSSVCSELTPSVVYMTKKDCFKGMCMAVLVSEGLDPHIVSVHSCGHKTEKNKGYGQCVSAKQIESTLGEIMESHPSFYMECTSTGTMKTSYPEYGIHQTGDVHPKSPVSWVKSGTMKVYGDITGHRSKNCSRVENTKICDLVAHHCDHPVAFGPPKNIGNWKPKYAALEQHLDVAELPWDDFQYATTDYRTKVFEGLNAKPYLKKKLVKLGNQHVLNGIDGIRGLDAVNWTSSAGFPINSPKKNFVERNDEQCIGVTDPVKIPEHFWEEVRHYETEMIAGRRVYPVSKAHLKDEAKKLESEKVRVMYGTPFAFLLLMRRHMLCFSKMYMDNPKLFETTVGMNVFGPEWNELAESLKAVSEERLLGGDLPGCDKRMGAQTMLAEGRLLRDIKEWSGNFDEEDLKVHDGIITELAYPVVDFFSTMIELMGSNMSGHSLTIVFNGIYVSWCLRSAFHHIYKASPTVVRFDTAVVLVTNGDDNVGAVKEAYAEYNFLTVKEYLDTVGVGFTMPNKEEGTKKYSHLTEVDYLKRNFRYSEEMKRYHPALDVESIFKLLQVGEKSKDKLEEEQCALNIETALQEFYYHGPDVFHRRRAELSLVAEEACLLEWFKGKQLPTYAECQAVDEEQQKSGSQLPVYLEHQSGECTKSEISGPIWIQNQKLVGSIGYRLTKRLLLCVSLGLLLIGIFSLEKPLFRGVLPHENRMRLALFDSTWPEQEQWITTTANSMSNSVTNVVNQAQEIDKHQTLVFRDGSEQWVSAIPNMFDRTRDAGIVDDVPLNKFFERPLKTRTFLWDPAAATKYFASFNPWNDYFFSPRIVNRICNYHLMRCKLKVKILLNGNSFYYGRLMAEVALGQDPLAVLSTGVTTAPLVQASQRLHGYLDPTESQGCILCIPYISAANNMVIANGDWSQQSVVFLREMNKLKHSNGSVNPITISVFVWAEDVTLSIPTSAEANGLVAQGGICGQDEPKAAGFHDSKEIDLKPAEEAAEKHRRRSSTLYEGRGDRMPSPPKKKPGKEESVVETKEEELEHQTGEYSAGGAVSSMMSSVASMARRFTSLPTIGAYAKATEMAATGAGNMAKLFGFSRPAIINDLTIIKRSFIGPMAVTDRGDPCCKLSVDSKQELTVDPMTFGVSGVDEMDLAYLAGIESYLTTFPWTIASRADTILFSIAVTPNVWQTNGGYYFLPSCAFAAQPFRYWRGTMIYRFQIVASAFHKGRLLITYSPGSSFADTNTLTQYSRIVDLANERDFTMEVGWASPTSMLSVGDLSTTVPYAAGANTTQRPLFNNGQLVVFVQSDLTSPSDVVNNDISINVFVKAGEDISYSAPVNRFTQYTYNNIVAPQSGELEHQSGEIQESSASTNAPIVKEVQECVAPCVQVDNTYDVFIGERVFSLRQLLKRYMYHTSYVSRTPNVMNYFTENDFPVYRGTDTTAGRHQTVTAGGAAAAPANIVTTTLLNFVSPAFVGYRGSMRSKYLASANTTVQGGRMIVTRINDTSLYGITSVPLNFANDSVYAANMQSSIPSLAEGGDVTDMTISPVIEVEFPYYSNLRYTNTRTTTGNNEYTQKCHRMFWYSPTANSSIDRYVSVGEDFQLFLFQGCPPFQVGNTFLTPTT
jgi:hypothetical protein